MTGIFPINGVPPGQTINAEPNGEYATGCSGLFYPVSRCNTRFDPAAMNAVMSEIINFVNCGGTPYDCTRLDNMCRAARDLVLDILFGCLDRDFPLVQNACSIEQLVWSTDASGCSRIARYSADQTTFVTVTERSVWGTAGNAPPRLPATPANPNTFYQNHELGRDANAGTIDPTKLNPNRVTTATFTLPCAMCVELQMDSLVHLNPAANGGNGAQSRIVMRIDGDFNVDVVDSPFGFSIFSNFQASHQSFARISLPAGTHTIDTFIVMWAQEPAQIQLIAEPIRSANGFRARPCLS